MSNLGFRRKLEWLYDISGIIAALKIGKRVIIGNEASFLMNEVVYIYDPTKPTGRNIRTTSVEGYGKYLETYHKELWIKCSIIDGDVAFSKFVNNTHSNSDTINYVSDLFSGLNINDLHGMTWEHIFPTRVVTDFIDNIVVIYPDIFEDVGVSPIDNWGDMFEPVCNNRGIVWRYGDVIICYIKDGVILDATKVSLPFGGDDYEIRYNYDGLTGKELTKHYDPDVRCILNPVDYEHGYFNIDDPLMLQAVRILEHMQSGFRANLKVVRSMAFVTYEDIKKAISNLDPKTVFKVKSKIVYSDISWIGGLFHKPVMMERGVLFEYPKNGVTLVFEGLGVKTEVSITIEDGEIVIGGRNPKHKTVYDGYQVSMDDDILLLMMDNNISTGTTGFRSAVFTYDQLLNNY